MKHPSSFSMDFDKCVKCEKKTQIGLMRGSDVLCLNCYEEEREREQDEFREENI